MSTHASSSRRNPPPQSDSWVVIPQESEEWKRISASIHSKWSALAACYTTPGLRPLGEPPILDWERFSRIHIYSNLRYERLFPDPDDGKDGSSLRPKAKGKLKGKARENRARMKDLKGESAALFEYLWALRMLLEDEELDAGRRGFYEGLEKEIEGDWQSVDKERVALLKTASGLAKFEYKFLSNDGKVDAIKEWLRVGADLFKGYGEEVEKRYGYLKKKGWLENPDKTFEAHNFDPDGTLATLQWEIHQQPVDRLIIWDYLPEAHHHIRYTKVEKKAMWFIPNERPLAEPPVILLRNPAHLDWSILTIPEGYNDMYPDDPERRARLKDLQAEEVALGMYFPWAMETRTHAPKERMIFYQNLSETLGDQFSDELGEECQAFWEEQAALHEAKRLRDVQDAERVAELAELRRLKKLEERKAKAAEEEATSEAQKWRNVMKGSVWSALAYADRNARLRY